MTFVVSSIADLPMNKITLWIRLGVDDWTVRRVIIEMPYGITLNKKHSSVNFDWLR